MKKRILLPVKIAGSVGLVAFLYARVDRGGLLAALRGVDLRLVVLILALFFFNTLLSSVKWRILLHADGIRVPLPALVVSYLVGTFFNLFLPSNIGGDAYRVYDVARLSDRPAHAFASVFADRLTGFAALVTLGLLAALAAYPLLPDRRLLVPVGAAFAAILFLLWALTQERLLRWGMAATRVDRLARLRDFFDKFMASIRVYRTHPGLLGQVLGLSFLFQGTAVVCIWLMARALHIGAPLLLFFAFVPLISLLEALPISVYGLGVRDAAYVLFFAQAGVQREQALAMALLYVALTLVYALSGGLLFVLRPRPAQPSPRPPASATHNP